MMAEKYDEGFAGLRHEGRTEQGGARARWENGGKKISRITKSIFLFLFVLLFAITMAEADTSPSSVESRRKRGFFFRLGGKKREGRVKKREEKSKENGNASITAASPSVSSPPNNKSDVKKEAETNKNEPFYILKKETKPETRDTVTMDISTKTSWLCRTRYFRRMCDWAFVVVDTDQSGTVDEKELYSGLLLIHLKLGTFAGPAACRPLKRERCARVFEKFDNDNSGSLDEQEFREVMMVLFSNVLFRVLVQWSMTIMIVPLVAQRVLNGIYWLIEAFYDLVVNLDEYSTWADKIELTVEATGSAIIHMTPGPLLMVADEVFSLMERVPESVWNTVPLTLLSTILGILVVPLIIFKVDDFFQFLADRRAQKNLPENRASM